MIRTNTDLAKQVEEYLTTRQLAQESGIPEATFRYWRHCGTGPASFKMGRRVVYRRSAVVAWIDAMEKATTRGGVA